MKFELPKEFFDNSIKTIENWPPNGNIGFFKSKEYKPEDGWPAIQLALVQSFFDEKDFESVISYSMSPSGKVNEIQIYQDFIQDKFIKYCEKNPRKYHYYSYYLHLQKPHFQLLLIDFFKNWRNELYN